MKINKSKSPFISGADAPDEKDIAKAVKGDKFAEALSALESTSAEDPTNETRATLTKIAGQYDLSNEENRKKAVRESAEFMVKSRLGEKYKESEKTVKDLGKYVADDPFLRSKLLSILHKLSDKQN